MLYEVITLHPEPGWWAQHQLQIAESGGDLKAVSISNKDSSTTSLFIQTEDERKSFFYFGWVLLALGGWVFSQTPSKFILFRNPALWLNLSFAALYLLLFFLVKYIQYSYPIGAWLKPFSLGSIIFAFVYVIGGILQYTGLLQYTDMLLISGLGLEIFLLMLLAMLVYERNNFV